MQITIVNYGMGNLRSVINAFEVLGGGVRVIDNPADLADAHRIVLPGVGAFGDGMANLRSRGWVPALEEEVRGKGKPFLGLCLGMQLLASQGTEHGTHDGLGWIAGKVDRLRPSVAHCRVPHIGWNEVRVAKADGLYRGLPERPVFYFVHSYAFVPEDDAVVSGWAEHGGEFAASLERGNIMATQYHPEKSQKHGLALLRNFMEA